MTAKLTSGGILFADGTTLTSNVYPWINITGSPTNLSYFSNDANYIYPNGENNCWVYSNFTGIGGNCGGNTNCSNCYPTSVGYTTQYSGAGISYTYTFNNCNYSNCNCNCNC